jgi:hypothetical protein
MPEIYLPDLLNTIAPQQSSDLLLALCEHLFVAEETTRYMWQSGGIDYK